MARTDPDITIHLDAAEAERRKQDRERRFHLTQVPRLRIAGFVLMVGGAWVHNSLILGRTDPQPLIWLTVALGLYVVATWVALHLFYDRVRVFNLGDALLLADLVPLAWVVYATGAEKSLLFFLMMVRVSDQASRGLRRALLFTHAATAIYALLIVYVGFVEHRSIDWGVEGAKILFIYCFNLYVSFTALTTQSLRQRMIAAIRLGRELIRDLGEAKSKAEAASEAKSEFLANMSHEVRTPMNAVIGLTQLLRREELTPEARHLADNIATSAEALLRVMDDILDFSRIEAGKLEIEQTPCQLWDLLEGARNLFAPEAGKKDLDLRLEIHPEVPAWVEGDPARLRQVLVNLLDNALKFTPEGEVELRAAPIADGGPEAARGIEQGEGAGRRICFTVRDTGPGIAPEHQEKIFSPFTQVDSSASRRFGGTGLGLAISRRIVTLMGGELLLSSAPGQGSTFSFSLPLDPIRPPSPDAGPPVRRAAAVDGARPPRILLAEDEPISQMIARVMLEQLGYEVEVAGDGSEVLAALAAGSYELLLLDCQMPELDGYETARQIRLGEGGNEHLPIVALTAHAMKGDREKCLAAGMDDYLSKPFQEADLAAMLERWLPTP